MGQKFQEKITLKLCRAPAESIYNRARSTQAGGSASGRPEFSKAQAGKRSRETNLVQAVGQEIPEEKGEPSSRIQASHTACVKFEKERNIKEQGKHVKELERQKGC